MSASASPRPERPSTQRIAVFTSSRSEYYQLKPLLSLLQRHERFDLRLFVSGTHLSSRFGKTERDIRADGFEAAERLPILVDEDGGVGAALTAGLAVQSVAAALVRQEIDLLIVLGDRYEHLAAGFAALLAGVPVAHVHGGERTDGAIDDACRHALTKISHLHFVSTDVYAARVRQLGEPSDRVFDVGAPFLDVVRSTDLYPASSVEAALDLPLRHPVALVSYHPSTRDGADDGETVHHLLEAVGRHCRTVVLTAPNADPGAEAVRDEMAAFAGGRERCRFTENLGSRMFLSVMSVADVMVGNSSSGIHEASFFSLPVVNVGSRQAGRLRPANVIDVAADRDAMDAAVRQALAVGFRERLEGVANPYGDGHASARIVERLALAAPFHRLLNKTFADAASVEQATQHWKARYA